MRSLFRKPKKLNSISGIVSVHDTFYDNNTSYIVMDYVEGTTLKKYLNNNGVISYEKIVTLFSPLLKSLEKAHKNGLIHRDISPDNIMINEDGELMLLDLGAAKDLNLNNNEFSMPVMKQGFSPAEQYMTKGEIGPWTDVYAMCATIYYCLYGKVVSDSMERLMTDDLSFPKTAFGELPDTFKTTLTKGLACRKDERIQSMSELLAGLEGKIEFKDVAVKQEVNQIQPTMPVMDVGTNISNGYAQANVQIQPTMPVMNTASNPNVINKKPGNKKPFIIGAVALLAVLLIVLIVVKPFSKEKKTSNSNTTEQVDVATDDKKENVTEEKTTEKTTEKETEETTEQKSKNDEKVYVYVGWSDSLSDFAEYFYAKYPEYKDKLIIKHLECSASDLPSEVEKNLNSDEPPSIVFYDSEYVSELFDTSIYYSMDEIGITDADTKDMYQYTKDMATNNGKLMGLSYNICPGGFIYNSDIATEVFGTSDPSTISSYFLTWDGVLQAGEMLKAKGYYLVPQTQCVARYMGSNYNQSVIDTMISNGYSKGVGEWSTEETEALTTDTFGIFGCTWYLLVYGSSDKGQMTVNVGLTPNSYYWGGNVLGVTKSCPDIELARLFLYELCCDYDTMYSFGCDLSEIPNNMSVVEKFYNDNIVPDSWYYFDNIALEYNPMIVFDRIARGITE